MWGGADLVSAQLEHDADEGGELGAAGASIGDEDVHILLDGGAELAATQIGRGDALAGLHDLLAVDGVADVAGGLEELFAEEAEVEGVEVELEEAVGVGGELGVDGGEELVDLGAVDGGVVGGDLEVVQLAEEALPVEGGGHADVEAELVLLDEQQHVPVHHLPLEGLAVAAEPDLLHPLRHVLKGPHYAPSIPVPPE